MVYRMLADDGIDRRFRVIFEDKEFLTVEATHRLGSHEIIVTEQLNRCLFEDLVNLGVLVAVA